MPRGIGYNGKLNRVRKSLDRLGTVPANLDPKTRGDDAVDDLVRKGKQQGINV